MAKRRLKKSVKFGLIIIIAIIVVIIGIIIGVKKNKEHKEYHRISVNKL